MKVSGHLAANRRTCSLARPALRALTALTLAMTTLGVQAMAQPTDWPSRPITIIAPYAAGGNNDIMARLAGQWLSERLKQRFVVENRVGAGGAIAAAYVAEAAPDGYTLLFAASPQIGIVPYLQKVKYHPLNDFIQVSAFGSGPFVLAIKASIPARTVDELITYARSRSINYGSAGLASVGHLSGALFVARNRLDATHITFRGGGPAMVALLGGQIDMYFGNASEIVPHAENNNIRILGVAAERAITALPNAPAIKEYAIPTWNGFLVPAKTPKPIVDRLAANVIAATRDPAVASELHKLGIEPNGTTPEAFAEWIRRDQPLFDAAIAAAQLKPQE
jgi:tripartite-type tricarboxylate transporter receptor subunit TctC